MTDIEARIEAYVKAASNGARLSNPERMHTLKRLIDALVGLLASRFPDFEVVRRRDGVDVWDGANAVHVGIFDDGRFSLDVDEALQYETYGTEVRIGGLIQGIDDLFDAMESIASHYWYDM